MFRVLGKIVIIYRMVLPEYVFSFEREGAVDETVDGWSIDHNVNNKVEDDPDLELNA